MSEQQSRNVLLLVGENDGADFVAHALAHPQLALHPANEETMATALAHGPYDLAVVGGYVGSRGPLILCEAVRVQQKIPILILVGQETSEKVLTQHKERKLDHVTYLDFQGWRDPAGSVVEVGTEVRTSALGILELEEDATYGEQWQQSLAMAQEQRDAALAQQRQAEEQAAQEAAAQAEAQRAQAEAEADEEEAETGEHPPEERREHRDEAPPPFRAKLTDEDLEFMDRIIERTKNVDFRAKLTKSATSDHADAATQKLRDHIRELERDRARLAFVYRSRRLDFEAYDDAVQRVDEAERHLQAVRDESERRVQQIRDESARSLHDMQQHLSGALGQTQQTLVHLQEQAAAQLAQLQEQIRTRDETITGLREEHAAQLANREAELANLKAHNDQQQASLDNQTQQLQQSAAEREQLITQYSERERAALDASTAQERQLRQENETLNRARTDAEARIGAVNVSLDAAREEITRLQGVEAEKSATVESLQAQVTELQAQLHQQADLYQQQTAAAQEQTGLQLEQQQSAFAQEREQLQQQIAASQEALQAEMDRVQAAAAAERQQLEAGFASERQRHQELVAAAHQAAQAEASALNEKLAALQEQHKVDLLAAEEKLRHEAERLQKEFAQEREQQQANLRAVEDGLRQEIDRVQTAANEERSQLEERLAEQTRAHEEQLAATDKEWNEKYDQMKKAAGAFRDANVDDESYAAQLQTKIDGLEQQLADKEKEVERLVEAGRKGVDEEALERLARRFDRGLENVKSQITKQEALLVTAGIPGAAGGGAAAVAPALEPTEEVPALAAGAPSGARGVWRWLRAQPERLIGVGAVGAALLVTIIMLIAFAVISPDRVVVAGEGGSVTAAGGDDGGGAAEAVVDAEAEEDADHGEAEADDEPEADPEPDAEEPAIDEAEADGEADTDDTAEEAEAESEIDETEPTAAPTGDGSAPGSPEFETQRKALRKELFAAIKKKSWNNMIELGNRLRDEYRLDWEAEFRIAEALQKAKRLDEAVAAYEAFGEANPENAFADDAALRAGTILLEQGKKKRAKPHLEKAAKSGSKKTAGAAKALLKKL